MCLFKRKKEKKEKENPIVENLSKIKHLYTNIEMLIHVIEDKKYYDRLVRIGDVIKYLAPTKKQAAIKIENKIENKIDDLKTVILNKKDSNKIETLLIEIELLVIERKNEW